ncbi:hypothetical protein [Frigoriglobus tundricola]|uniref:hypothetical protein n=1 Tax=Frigoriglobus tundricola TaxID=2774151 RepID=UPI00148EC944|nr:hypothetical protein [Frigoriglobus tundricola]
MRFARRDLIVASVAVVGALVACLGLGVDWRYAAALAALGSGLALLVIAVGWAYTRASVAKFRAMSDPTVRWSFGDESFATRSDLGAVELHWKSVSAVWCFPKVWLLFFGTHGWGYSTLPVEGLQPELREYILARIQSHGGKIA